MSPALRFPFAAMLLAAPAAAWADAPVDAPAPPRPRPPVVSLVEAQLDILGYPGVPPWSGYFLGGSVLLEHYFVKGFGVGLYESLHLQPPSFGFTLITQTQISAGYTFGWTSQKRVQFGAYLLAGLLIAGSRGSADYPNLGVNQTYSAVSVLPVISGLLSLRVWVSRLVALSAQIYIPAYPFLPQVLDNQAKMLSIGVTIAPGREVKPR